MTEREHIDTLARYLDVYITYDVDPDPNEQDSQRGLRINLGSREMHLAPWEYSDTLDNYWGALHELGHAATLPRSWQRTDDVTLLTEEVLAWNWAIEHSMHPLTDDVRGMLAYSLASYIEKAPYVPEHDAVRRLVSAVGPAPNMHIPWNNQRYIGRAMRAWERAAYLATT